MNIFPRHSQATGRQGTAKKRYSGRRASPCCARAHTAMWPSLCFGLERKGSGANARRAVQCWLLDLRQQLQEARVVAARKRLYSVKFIRRSRSWKRGSDLSPSNMGCALTNGRSGHRAS